MRSRMIRVRATVIRADGTREDLGTVAYWHASFWRRQMWRMAYAARHLRAAPELAATVITNGGKAIVTNRINGAGTTPNYVAWGTGAGTAAAGDTTLFTEASEARVAGTTSRVTITVTNDTFQVVGTITAAAAKTITNAGLFDASTGGTLYLKGDFTGQALNANDSIQFTFQHQVT